MNVSIKCFGVLNQYVDSVNGGTAPVGELSDNSMTFSIDKDYIRSDSIEGGSAVVFSNKKEDGSEYTIPPAFRTEILDIIDNVATFDDQSSAEDQFDALYSAKPWTELVVGPSILASGRHIPSFIVFSYDNGTDVIEFKIWFSDSAFENDYDEWEIRIIPPVTDLNGLYGTYADVTNALTASSYSSRLSQVMALRDRNPMTYFNSVTVKWIDRSDSSRFINTDWTILGYGPRSSIHSNIMEAVREFLIGNSSYTLEQWVEHFPEIIALDIYTFIPLWDQPSISIEGQADSIFNPTIAYGSIVPKTQLFIPTLSESEIEAYVDTTSILYKSIGFITLGESANSPGSERFSDKFSDYAVLGVNDSNINRLSELTKQTIQGLERLARQCEIDDGVSPVPADMARLTLGQLTVVSLVIGTVQLQMATKESYISVIETP